MIPGTFLGWFCIHPQFDWTYIYWCLPVAVVLTVIMAVALPWDGSYPCWWPVLTILAIASGLAWTYILVEILIDILNGVGIILNLDKAYLGLTVLAIGNALPDAFTTITLSSQGYGVLAISGAYAGQLFGYLIGFGVSMLKLTLQKGPQTFDLYVIEDFNNNILSIIVLWFAGLTLVSTFIYGFVNSFKMDKFFGCVLFFYYFVFIIVASVFAFFKAYKTY